MKSSDRYLGRILVVDDDYDMLMVLRSSLEASGCRVDVCQSVDEMKDKIRQFRFDAVLLDLIIGEDNGIEALPFLVREAPHSIIIVMTAYGSIEMAVEAMGRGATSFLTKSEDPGRITRELLDRLEKAQHRMRTPSADIVEASGFIGQSRAIRQVIDYIEQIKDSDATVLISGESGTGKEVVARAIHASSKRAAGRFEALNCAAIPETLLESELFGHRKGAFTDARTDRKGIFELCSEGTLLLDEIGEMPFPLQAKLLRVLQEKEVMPVGSTARVKVETRVIAATNRDIEDEVMRGRFREDLYYRLNVLQIQLPPLRERIEDLPALVDHFVRRFNERYQKTIRPPSREVIVKLSAWQWPGNVRELENSIERAVVLSKDDELHVEDVLQRKMSRAQPGGHSAASEPPLTFSYAEAKEHFERAFMTRILTAARGSIAEAARMSGRYRSDIYRLLEKYKIDVDQFKA